MPKPRYIFRFLRMREPVDAGILKQRSNEKRAVLPSRFRGRGRHGYPGDQQGVGDTGVDAAAEPFDIGDEQVVADQLHLVAEAFGHGLPAVPVLLVQRILDGDQRVGIHQLLNIKLKG